MVFPNSLGTMIYISSSAMRMEKKKGEKKDDTLLISYTCSYGGVVCALYQGTACSKSADKSWGK